MILNEGALSLVCLCADTASEPETFEIPDVFIGDAFVEPFSRPPERRRGRLQRSATIRDDSRNHMGMRLVRDFFLSFTQPIILRAMPVLHPVLSNPGPQPQRHSYVWHAP